jgi:signal transduction histidine kinase
MPTDDGSRTALRVESAVAQGGASTPGLHRVLTALPSLTVLALAVGYIGIDAFEGLDEPIPGAVPPAVHAGLVAAQALALVFRLRAPTLVFALVVLCDAVLLATSAGELATGAMGAMFATYAVVRGRDGWSRYVAVAVGAVVTAVVSAFFLFAAAAYSPLAILAVVVARPLLQYAIPAGVAEYVLAREKLVQALRERAELAERERVRAVDREIAEVRTAMARELHDIAAHHLSGIIVGAQAASALVSVDPDRTRDMLTTVQRDARTTLADLRRTVGLLRSDDPHEMGTAAAPAAIPRIDGIARLVESARGRGQHVEVEVVGDQRPVGPLADTAGYRMVQESLANAARHAAGAPVRVRVEYLAGAVQITVENDPAPVGTPGDTTSAGVAARTDRGYGIAGMEERAELVGAQLTTGPLPAGGWRNRLDIPLEHHTDDSGSAQ